MWLLLKIFQVIVALTLISHHQTEAQNDLDWELYKAKHGVRLRDAFEDSFRRNIWATNMKRINDHNQWHSIGAVSYTLEMNENGIYTFEEFIALRTGYKSSERFAEKHLAAPRNPRAAPQPANAAGSFVDWRTEGYVGEIRDQGQCGSCWAFSVIGALEGQWFKKTGQLLDLSEKQLLDCDTAEFGCDGGYMDRAFNYIQGAGVTLESSYPYVASQSTCQYSTNQTAARTTGYINILAVSEAALTNAITNVGPISVGICVIDSFQFYKSGVYYDPKCSSSSRRLNHAVVAVGYGTDTKGGDYYIVRNSWGPNWGMNGYIWMARNRRNNCGIATEARYPIV